MLLEAAHVMGLHHSKNASTYNTSIEKSLKPLYRTVKFNYHADDGRLRPGSYNTHCLHAVHYYILHAARTCSVG